MRLSGYLAIEFAEVNGGLPLNKYADPIEDAREGLTVDEARAIAREDPRLIWIEADSQAACCAATKGVYACTLNPGHAGEHIAHSGDAVSERWTDEESA